VAPVASNWPDGLERVAGKLGFEARAVSPLLHSPFGEYRIPALGRSGWSTALAGFVGTLAAFVLSLLLVRALVPPSRSGPTAPDA